MKIRIKKNSVRLRLTRTEVETFCSSGRFEAVTQFPNGTFTYTLKVKEAIENIDASLEGNGITIFISKGLVNDWATNSKVGFQYTLPLKNEDSLSLLIEKDFVCMDQSVEDQSDNYPNPKMEER